MPCYRSDLKPSFGGVLNEIALHTIENSYDTSIICFQQSCSVFIVFFIRLKGRLMDFEAQSKSGRSGAREIEEDQ